MQHKPCPVTVVKHFHMLLWRAEGTEARWVLMCWLHLHRYLIGLPLWQKNAVELSRQIMKDAHKYLGDAVIGFELGNEVR